MKHQISSVVCTCAALLMNAGMLYAQTGSGSAPPAGQVQEASTPSQGSKDVDRSVAYPLAQVLDAAKQALTTYGCDIKKEGPEYLECTRGRHVGVLVGSGGEKVTVRLGADGSQTRVEIKTGKGLVGRLGKKNRSTPIFDEIVKTLAGS